MVGISLAAAILLAIPLGVLAFYRRRIGRVVFAVADVCRRCRRWRCWCS